MVATRNNPSEDRIILGRFFRYPRIGPGYTWKNRGRRSRRSSLGCLVRWLMDCTKSLNNPEARYHSYEDFADELGFHQASIRNVSYLNEKSTDGEIFVQLSYWIEEIFGYKDDNGNWCGPKLHPDELLDMSNYDDIKGIKWMSVASRIQEHVKATMRDRKLKV